MNETRATRYQRLRRRARAAGMTSGALMLGLVALTPASRWLADQSHAFGRGLEGGPLEAAALAVFVLLLLVLWETAALPAILYLSRRVDRRYGPAASVEDVLIAQAHATLVAAPAALGAAVVWLVTGWLMGGWWWIGAALLYAGALVAALRMAPHGLARLATTRPLAPEARAIRVADLARRAGVSVSAIDEWQVDETSGVTALVTGVGRTRRVLVSADLVRHWSDDEIAVLVAHELAHHRYHDLWRTLALDALLFAAALGAGDFAARALAGVLSLGGPHDLAALPLVALVGGLVWISATPIRHAQSRGHERRADVYALAMTGAADAFTAAVRRLGAQHLAEERPTALTRWLFHRHPTVADRLELAESYRRVKSA
jgi:Zn-dependent protease with chaperone function